MVKQAFKTIEWLDGKLRWLNTLKLPYEEEYIESSDYERVAEAIEKMEIRGAPAIGVAAAFAVALAAYNFKGDSAEDLRKHVLRAIERLRRTRPTAVNLFWALSRMKSVLDRCANDVASIKTALISEALRIYNEDIEINVKIGEIGSKVIEDGDTVLTHCNAGALATAGYGTALGVIRAAWYSGKRIKVIATETRPVLQGARLTVWELKKEGIPVTLITDNMVGYVMSKGLINKIVVGADRILLSGHVINKIGTYTIAVLAKHHNIPFYVAAPTSTVDTESKLSDVVIEERNPDEVRYVLGKLLITVKDVPVLNPAFDITPPELVTGIITEKGIATQPLNESLRKVLNLG
ncbi:MAG: S-methyl-5-thioribose-1-phosphate isomerase [Desulfurococcales archaeon]|nr:S-methyl-5-thioribose-1-phosphate isomerase [Desulfurococcales archaeon]